MSQERKPERVRDEKINGVIYDMSPAPAYQHSQVIGQIFAKIKNELKGSMCLVFMENIDYKYSRDNDDYLEPDLIICCDRSAIRGNSYYSTPKFVAEAISPSTVKRDRGIKKDIYESCGVEEYWILSPVERAVEIYYLESGNYILEQNYMLQNDKEEEDYNGDTEICLKAFPQIKMTLGEIFEGMD